MLVEESGVSLRPFDEITTANQIYALSQVLGIRDDSRVGGRQSEGAYDWVARWQTQLVAELRR